ncbi:recombination mediator RecR [Marinicella gelatinilytica]|uniref:recombination mediator RecR n=1 Tax=Marinicella gelatinilytica TaxID=2996017 RepID=UPI00226092BD|nr:recombination mediator RecR [Marinicella gelatinilytica]MCX7546280.1 recombination mediator RecR [Marinicella gelatinilytica]
MSLVTQLMDALQIMPGVGPKSAQRLTFFLLQKDKDGARALAKVLGLALDQVKECDLCRTLTENDICNICSNDQRHWQQLCVVESPADIIQIEQATDFKGRYFVLHGKLSPLDGLGPSELKLNKLIDIMARPECQELIVATGSTVEGETTAQYLANLAEKGGIKASRLAHGVPLGGDLEYIDNNTLAHAFAGRTFL